MMYAGRMLLLAVTLVASAAALPNHLKAVVVDTEPVVSVPHVSSGSASVGGYSANAGLGGAGAAGGLFASAESPFGSASVGLVGSVPGDKGSSASSAGGTLTKDQGSAGSHAAGTHASAPPPGHNGGYKPGAVHQGPGSFDGIFNIPISVLQAVNTYLNNRGPVTKPVHRRRGHRPRPRPSHADDEDVVYKTVVPVKGEGPSPTERAATPAASPAVAAEAAPGPAPAYNYPAADEDYQGHAVVYKRVNYDDIFNIPISALKSVNDLLNG